MIKDCKICGISDPVTLNYLINHPSPPRFIGFICNYKNSPRYVETDRLKELVNLSKKNINFVAVLVKPDNEILEKIKDLNFDYYQLYDCSPNEIKSIKNKYNKKIISAFTIESIDDVNKHIQYKDVTDIFLFDSKGYEKSLSFDHSLIKSVKLNKEIMLAGKIRFDEDLENFMTPLKKKDLKLLKLLKLMLLN